MDASNIALKFLRGTLIAILLAAFAAFLFTGLQYNQMMASTVRVSPTLCQSQPTEFQRVDMKGEACVARATALDWNRNQRFSNIAILAYAISFAALFLAQRGQAGVATPKDPNIASVGVVICVAMLLFWGVWPAVIGAAILTATLIGRRLRST